MFNRFVKSPWAITVFGGALSAFLVYAVSYLIDGSSNEITVLGQEQILNPGKNYQISSSQKYKLSESVFFTVKWHDVVTTTNAASISDKELRITYSADGKSHEKPFNFSQGSSYKREEKNYVVNLMTKPNKNKNTFVVSLNIISQ